MRGALLALALSATFAACDDSSAVKEGRPSGPDASTSADGGGAPDSGGDAHGCFDDPKTHFEIINACTTSTKIAKSPTLGKLLPDGGLPPLP